jgi:hypothetical protein
MQMVYVAEEDRILFRVNSTDKKEFRFWVTRRYAMLLAKVLWDHKASDPDVSQQPTTEGKQAVQEFKKEKAIEEASFGQKFEDEGNQYPLGESIPLAFQLTYNMKEDGALHLSIRPKEGQGINVVINQDINITLTQLLLTAAKNGDWKLDEWIANNPSKQRENIVIN